VDVAQTVWWLCCRSDVWGIVRSVPGEDSKFLPAQRHL